jgi:DNA-binding CsgD family transcriptional regulator
MKKYKVTLTQREVEELREITQKGKRSARVIKNALILINADEGKYGKGKKDEEIADFLDITVRTIENIRKRFIEDGFEAALSGKATEREYKYKIDGDAEAHLIAMSCSEPPKGFARWSLRLLADKMVELKYIDDISHETVRRVLKKTS